MICTEIKGNIFELERISDNDELYGFEIVALSWDECAKRILRKKTDIGKEIGVSLSSQTILRHGDVLFQDEEHMILVFVQPCEVLVIFAASIQELGVLSYEIGNRHLPLQITEKGELVLLPDHPTEVLLKKLNAHYEKQSRRFQPIPKGGGHNHDDDSHNHGHSHDHKDDNNHNHDHSHSHNHSHDNGHDHGNSYINERK